MNRSNSDNDIRPRKNSIFKRSSTAKKREKEESPKADIKSSKSNHQRCPSDTNLQILPNNFDINIIKQLFFDNRSKFRQGKHHNLVHSIYNRHLTFDEYYAIEKGYLLNSHKFTTIQQLLRRNHSVQSDTHGSTFICDFIFILIRSVNGDRFISEELTVALLPSNPVHKLQKGEFCPISVDTGILTVYDQLLNIDNLKIEELGELCMEGKYKRRKPLGVGNDDIDIYMISLIDFLIVDFTSIKKDLHSFSMTHNQAERENIDSFISPREFSPRILSNRSESY